MTGEPSQPPVESRGTFARIGICLLNLLAPGLGFFRLSRFRAGFVAFGISMAATAALLGFFAWGGVLQAAGYLGAIAFMATGTILNFVITTWLTWRWSKEPTPHPHWLSRWYGIAGVWLLLQAAMWPFPDLVRSHYHNFYAPAVSMAPTIEVDDRFVGHMRDFDPIRRGDIVIVTSREIEFVKRVAAIPGDRIAMRDGQVILNGLLVPQSLVGKERRPDGSGSTQEVRRLRERFPSEARFHEVFDGGSTFLDDTAEVTLGPDQYFLLGDNRDNSADSRLDVSAGGLGVVDRSRVKGRVLFRLWRSGLTLAPSPL